MTAIRLDGNIADEFKAELRLQVAPMPIGGEGPSQSTANVIWNPDNLKCYLYQDKNGVWQDSRNDDIKICFRSRYRKLLFRSLVGADWVGLEVDLENERMANSNCNDF